MRFLGNLFLQPPDLGAQSQDVGGLVRLVASPLLVLSVVGVRV